MLGIVLGALHLVYDSLCSPIWPGTHNVDQIDLHLCLLNAGIKGCALSHTTALGHLETKD